MKRLVLPLAGIVVGALGLTFLFRGIDALHRNAAAGLILLLLGAALTAIQLATIAWIWARRR